MVIPLKPWRDSEYNRSELVEFQLRFLIDLIFSFEQQFKLASTHRFLLVV